MGVGAAIYSRLQMETEQEAEQQQQQQTNKQTNKQNKQTKEEKGDSGEEKMKLCILEGVYIPSDATVHTCIMSRYCSECPRHSYKDFFLFVVLKRRLTLEHLD